MAEPRTNRLKGSGYELFVLLVSVLSAINAVIVWLTPPSVARDVALTIDVMLTPVFLFDFVYRLRTAPSRTGYLVRDHGWADAIAIVPMLRIFRLFRIRSVVRQAREVGERGLVRDLVATRASATFFLTIFLVIAVVEFAGMAVYYAEFGAAGASIVSAGDAIWWGLVTITTVGYGDMVPVTVAGRVVGVFLLFTGIALFSVLTGFIANFFLAPRNRAKRERLEPGTVAAELDELRSLLADQEDRAALIRAKLDDLERAVTVAALPPAG